MARKFEYKMVCKYCGKTFTAHTSTTKYCSATCANRGHKAEARAKLQQAESEEIQERISKRTIRVKKSDLLNLYQNIPDKLTPLNTPIAEIRKAQKL